MQYVALLLKFGPLIFSTIKAFEAALPDSPGKQKFDSVMAFLTSTETELANAVPTLTTLVNNVVAAYNVSGVFTKKSA